MMIQHSMWKEMDSLRREMETMFNGLTSRTSNWSPVSQVLNGTSGRYPSFQMCDDNEAVYVEAVIPGANPDALDLSVKHNVLTLSGEKPQLFGENEPKSFHRKERLSGKFTRRMALPAEVDADRVSAEYTQGVLKVKLPKAEKAKPRQISITAA
jgi:HSP20 family protein